jgi:hypothetical protein
MEALLREQRTLQHDSLALVPSRALTPSSIAPVTNA